MKILITGNQGLAQALAQRLCQNHSVTMVSRSSGYDIKHISQWAQTFYHCDMFVNCAYDSWAQTEALETFYWAWKDTATKSIINIGSSISDYVRIDKHHDHEYLSYRVHKQSLQSAFAKMVKTAQCDIKLINPGPMDTNMLNANNNVNKMSPDFVAEKIVSVMFDPVIKRVDLWQ